MDFDPIPQPLSLEKERGESKMNNNINNSIYKKEITSSFLREEVSRNEGGELR